MWRIDRTADWPYYWICCCLNKPDTWEDDLTESTLESERCGDSVTDVMIMMFMLESFCLSWIIIPGVTPGETVTRWGWDPVWSDVKLSFVVRLPTTGITMYHSPHLHSHQCGPSHLHIPGDNILLGMITIYFCPPPPQAFFVQTTGCQLFPHKLMIAQSKHPHHWKLDQRFLKIQLEPVGITHYATKNPVLSLVVTLPCWSGNCSDGVRLNIQQKYSVLMAASQ